MYKFALFVVVGGVSLFSVSANRASAAVLVEHTTENVFGSRTPGQSFTTPADGKPDRLDSFTWFNFGNAVGGGNIYVLDRPYSGWYEGLNTGTPGYLGASNTYSGGLYTFTLPTPITLQPGVKYYVYTRGGPFNVSWDNASGYPGGESYFANGFAYDQGTSDFAFRANGTPVPEPSAGAVLAAGALAMGARRRRVNGR